MKKRLFMIIVMGFFLISFVATDVQAAGSKPYYWNSGKGAYYLKIRRQPHEGKYLNYWGEAQFKKAALRRYGSINKRKTYYFNFTNKISQVHLFSMKGSVINVVCIGRN